MNHESLPTPLEPGPASLGPIRAPLLFLFGAFGLGIGLFWWLRPSLIDLMVLFLGSTTFALLTRSPARKNLAILLLVGTLGGLRAWVDAKVPADSMVPFLQESFQPISCEGVVVSEIEWVKTPYGPARPQGWLKLKKIQHSKGWTSVSGKVRLRLPTYPFSVGYGDRLLVKGEIRGPATSRDDRGPKRKRNSHEAHWLWMQGACGVMKVSEPEAIKSLSLGTGPYDRYRRWVFTFRGKLQQLGRTLLPKEEAAYLEALLLGEGQGIPPQLEEAFRKTGTIHILVVSGFQVGLIAAISLTGLSLIRVPRVPRYLLVALGLMVYCTLTGAKPPIQRATLMGVLLCLGFSLGEGLSSLNLLGSAGLLLLSLSPRALADVSFQLSFAAVAGLLTLTPWMNRRLTVYSAGFVDRFPFWHWLAQGLSASLGAWVAVAPLVAWHFQIVTPIALLANLAIIPLASLLVAIGTVLYGLGWMWPQGALLFSASFAGLTEILSWLVTRLSLLPGAYFSWGR